MRFATKTLRHEGGQRTEDRGWVPICHPSSVFCLRGFTLVELVVAIAILAMVIFFAGVIFKSSIGSYRTALAQAEIMQKLRAITEQLDSDFKGLRKDAPMFIWFQKGSNGFGDANRFDQVMFFADGDFQATSNTIVGNLARIQYGQARSIDPRDGFLKDPNGLRDFDRLLTKRQHILTSDLGIPLAYRWPSDFSKFGETDPGAPLLLKNDTYEYDWLSLSEWQALATQSANVNSIIDVCFNNPPTVNTSDANTLHSLMTERVGSFSVQWGYYYTNAGQTFIYWWPSVDPDGNVNFSDSDFVRMSMNAFGIYFNVAEPPSPTNSYWFSYAGALYLPGAVVDTIYPRALKFTFTLYDSKNVFKDGQTFTHIVYLGD